MNGTLLLTKVFVRSSVLAGRPSVCHQAVLKKEIVLGGKSNQRTLRNVRQQGDYRSHYATLSVTSFNYEM